MRMWCRSREMCLRVRRSIAYGSDVVAALSFLVLFLYIDRYRKARKDCTVSVGNYHVRRIPKGNENMKGCSVRKVSILLPVGM